MNGTNKNSEMSDNSRNRSNEDDKHHDLEHLKKNETTSTTLVGSSYDCKKKDGVGKKVGKKFSPLSQHVTCALKKNSDEDQLESDSMFQDEH